MFNDLCIEKFKPDVHPIECVAKNYPYNPDMKYSEESMAKENPGCLPPHVLKWKPGCYLMLLRNWNLNEGLANGTRLRGLELSKKKSVIKCEILTGPRVKKPVVTLLQYTPNIYEFLRDTNLGKEIPGLKSMDLQCRQFLTRHRPRSLDWILDGLYVKSMGNI